MKFMQGLRIRRTCDGKKGAVRGEGHHIGGSMSNGQIRHGDVFLVPVQGVEVEDPGKNVVVQYGEVTGHAHRLSHAAKVTVEGKRYLRVDEGASIAHEEHGVIEVPPGVYEVVIERDYDPTLYARQVVD